MKDYYVYIMASKKNGTLYVGITSDLIRRVWQHRNKLTKGFTSKYNINLLVYFESTDDVGAAIHREKHIKEWKRKGKIKLIEKMNPYWKDLYKEMADA